MNPSAKPIPNPVVVLRDEFDDWAVLFHPDTAKAVGINPVGVAVWQVLDGKRTLQEIVEEVKNAFADVPETVLEDVTIFVTQLEEGGFVGYELGGNPT